MFINKNHKINTMKFLMAIMSVKISKLIPTVLLASILAISFALITSPNVFASQVQDTPIATFTYPDNWEIVETHPNGFSFQPVNEQTVYVHKFVYLDSSNGFGQIVNDYLQMHRDEGFEVSIIKNIPGDFWFDRSHSSNGMSGVGFVWINHVPNSNDIVVTEYFAEPSKAQQYLDQTAFYVETKASPQEANRYQTLNDKGLQMEMEMRNDLYKSNMKSWENFGDSFVDDDDNGWVN